MSETTNGVGRPTDATGSSSGGRVVVGVDASEESKQALRWAADYARFVGASLEVVHAWHPAEEHAWLQSLPPPASPTEVAREALAQVVDQVVGDREPNLQVRTAVIEGHAAKVLVQESRGATLLVVGNRGFGGFDGLLLGSISGQCATHAPCSVVIVRTDGAH
jgi:nucleotide-binding universal stress UspA family protein